MKIERIEKLLKGKSVRYDAYDKLSVLDLIGIMTYLETNLKSKKGNWTISNYNNYMLKHDIHPLHFSQNLLDFYAIYSKRKKKILTFERFINNQKINIHNKIFTYKLKNKRQIKNQKFTQEFLTKMKNIKEEYLIGISHEEWFNHICKPIELGYKLSVLRKMYYDY